MKNRLLNWFYYCAGLLFLFLAKVRNWLKGYTPKTFSMDDLERCVHYDIHVVDEWLACLNKYTESDAANSLKNKNILELGPGSDLGIGLYLLSKSIQNYFAVDVYDLANNVSERFYEVFFSFLRKSGFADTERLAVELKMTQQGNSKRLNYICREDFDIVKALSPHTVDFIFSNAAFEHFNDVHKTIEAISNVASSDAIFIALVDLKTHSRWIRDKDPDNIYRYPDWLYQWFRTRSIPNRVRPYQYEEALKKNEWKNIAIYAATELNDHQFDRVKNHLNKKFRDYKNQMKYLSVWICATRRMG